MCALHYIALSDYPHPKKHQFASSLTEDVNLKVPTGTIKKWKLPAILPTSRQKL